MVRLWKLHGGGSEPLAAVLFIHGLDGDPHETWNINPLSSENEETFWPLWLQESFPNLAVHSIEYEASKTNWGGGHALAIEERAESLKSYITTQLRPGRCLHGLPLILITHSLGGLIAKAMLRSSSENPARGPDDLLEQTCGVVFIATPHAGSDLAWWARIASLVVRPTVAVREMVPKEPNLLGLNSWYRDYCSRFYGIRSHAFYETMDTFGAKIVDAASADPAIAGLKATPIDSDHIKIAKPLDRRAHLYLRTVDFLEDVLNDLEKDSQLRAGNDLALERRDGQEVSSQDQFGYRQIPKNAFPDCINLHVEARQGTDETRISATATLECWRTMLDGDEDLKLRLVFDSVLITLHAEGGEVSASRGLGDGGSGGRYRYVRGSRHQVAISPNDETSWLEGLVLNHAPLPEIRAFPDYPCSLEVQIGAFPEDIRIEPVGTDDKPPSDCPAIRKHMIKLVLSKDLDRLPIQYERLDRVDDQLILSRVQLSAVSDLDPANGDVPGAAAKRGIDWKAIGRILVHPNESAMKKGSTY